MRAVAVPGIVPLGRPSTKDATAHLSAIMPLAACLAGDFLLWPRAATCAQVAGAANPTMWQGTSGPCPRA